MIFPRLYIVSLMAIKLRFWKEINHYTLLLFFVGSCFFCLSIKKFKMKHPPQKAMATLDISTNLKKKSLRL